MKPWAVWSLGLVMATLVVAPPVVRYRSLYAHHKRLRTVTPCKFYRSGQMTAEGFRDTVAKLGIRTIINVQDEFSDPILPRTFWDRHKVHEVKICRELGVRYVHLEPRTRPDRNNPDAVPDVVRPYLELLDDPAVYPVLLHCKAGLHRTGLLTAIYRMEYEGWSHGLAAAELKGHGFGDQACTAANDYVQQFLLNYRPRHDRVAAAE